MPERYVGRCLGRFRIDAPIGAGGFAWIYRGWDSELDIPVAVKVLKPQFAGDETFRTRFRREALTASHLRHPNIVRILGVGQDGDAVWFAMDYLPHNLTERLRALNTIPEAQLARIGAEVAAALAFAHREGVVHRDIKIDNILFDDHGNAIVADFGIARASSVVNEETATNIVVGTPQYFSPEQARGLALDGRSDIYSLGVTLYRAATGVLPFTGDDWYGVARRQIEEPPKPPREIQPSISPELERVILRCLCKRPDDRYPNAEMLRAELAAIAARDAVESTPTALLAPMPAPRKKLLSRRNVMMSGAVVAAVLVAATATRGFKPDPTPTPHLVPPTGASSVSPSSLAAIPSGTSTDSQTGLSNVGASTAAVVRNAQLRVTLPQGSELHVGDRTVAQSVRGGQWRSSELAPGSYWVTAVLASLPDCRTMRDSQQVTLTPGHPTSVTLTPKRCGLLSIIAPNDVGHFTLGVTGQPPLLSGTLPMSSPVVVPVGSYVLHAAAPGCAGYEQNVTIAPEQTMTVRFKMICGA